MRRSPRRIKCDTCEREIDVHDRVCVALPRPSDPSELCAVLWCCSLACAGVQEPFFDAKGAVGTAQYIGEFFDDDKVDETFTKYGYLFLSI